ncbi:MAG: DNA helicase II [Pseudomonadales bacterium]|nr:DNA helicase II [Pseudomonadales bacterium]
MDVSDILDQLNDAQREAVAAPMGNMLVLAGAGSGKTRVLIHRMAWLMQVESVSPHSILAVTFTNKAAKEMRARVEEMLGIPTQGLWIGTFHGLAHRLLKQHWLEAGLPQNFQILDGDDQFRLIKRIHKELKLEESKWPARQSQSYINNHKDEGRRAEHIDDFGDMYQRTMLQVYKTYQDACQRGGMVDFAEILLRSHELWLNQPQILQHYQQRFQHMMVDEFQDTNTIQYAWLRVLAGKRAHFMAVGDDDQSIYGWRGAKIENIRKMGDDFQNLNVIRLEQNYRSTATILKAANAVIANNSDRLGKNLWTDGEDGEPIDVYGAFNEYDEARYVVDKIEQVATQYGLNKTDIAILYRSNAQSRVLEEALIQAGLPYRIYGGQRFYDRLEIKHVMAYLRLSLNTNDDAAFERIINTPTRGIGNKSLEVLRAFARDFGCSLWDAIAGVEKHQLLTPRALNAFKTFAELIAAMQQILQADKSLDEQVDLLIKMSGLIPFFKKEKGEKGRARIENLEELVSAAGQFEDTGEADLSLLQQFIDQAALEAGDAQADEYEDSVQLMTLHSAKGLEFKAVFMVGVEEGLFPHKMSADDPGRLEEERRLCYVGVTRAMQRLFISYAEMRRLHGQETYNTPSRFLREFPSELLNEVRMKSTVSKPLINARATHNPLKAKQMDDDGFYLGQKVKHKKFGEGKVLQFEGDGASARVQVSFSGDEKWLVIQYANLEKL